MKKILSILLIVCCVVTLTGCGNIDDNVANNDVVQEAVSTEVTTEVQPVVEEHPVVEHLNSNKIIIEDFIVSNDAEKIGEKGRAAFIEFADFIFYDQEIEGYKYEELDEETKSKVYSKFCYIDNLVSGYNEDYKDSLEDFEELSALLGIPAASTVNTALANSPAWYFLRAFAINACII